MSWPVECLGNIAEFINGKAFKPSDWHEDGIKIIRIQNLTNPSKPYNLTKTDVKDKYIVKKGELLVSWSATIDVFVWNGENAAVNQHIFRVVPNEEVVNVNYLRHSLKNSLKQMMKYLHGSTMKHINRREFLATTIPLPPLKEQRRIAAILDKADEVNKSSNQSNEMRESLIRSAFIEFFGDSITNPKGWPKKPLVDVAEKVTVGYVGPVKKYLDDLGIPMFRTGNVGNYFLNHDKMIHISRDFHLKIQKSSVMKNDVLINRHVTDEMKCSIVSEEIGEANCMNMLLIRPGELLDPFFLSGLIQSKASQHELLQQKSGSAQQVVNTTRLRQWLIPVPPIKLQNQYASFATKILSEMADNYQLQDIVKLRGSLIQELIHRDKQ